MAGDDVSEQPHQPHILIVGAGFGGLGCIHTLGQLETPARVTIVDKKDTFTIGGTWQFVWTGRLSQDKTRWPLSSAALPPMASLMLNTSVSKLDLAAQKAILANGTPIAYDQLVLSPGVVSDGSRIPGLTEHALNLYCFDNVVSQKEQLEHFSQLAEAKVLASEKATLLISIAAVPYQCPVAPWEVAFLVDAKLRATGVREGARIVITAPNEWPLPDPTRPKFEAEMSAKQVEFFNNKQLAALEPNLAHYADGTSVAFDLAWAVYPQRAPDFVRDSGLVNARGFVPVDLQTNRIASEAMVKAGTSHVPYCIGDCCWTMIQPELPHPKAGEFAWQMGANVAKQIDATCRGEALPPPDKRKGSCFAEAGNGTVLLLEPDLSAVLADPLNGKPDARVSEAPEAAKVEWVNKHLARIFNGSVAPFIS